MAAHSTGSGAPYYTKIDISALTELIETYKIRTYPDTCDAYGLIYDILKDDTTKKRRPFFIVDLGQVIKKFEQWCECLPRVTPHYAVKCNPDPAIISVLGLMGCNFDCASQTEIAIVQDALKMHEETFADTTRILFANPIKDEEHIQYARANDVDMTVFDSSDELYKIKLYHTEANLLLRLNIDNPHSLINFGTKFGATMEEIPRLIDICRVLELNLIGVSFHVGTGCTDPLQYAHSLTLAKEVFMLAKSKGIHMNCVDIGGGFPGSDPVSDDEVSFEQIAEVINKAIDDLFGPHSEFPETQFIAEPGRFMVASSHTLVVNIIGKKVIAKTGPDGQPQKRFIYHLNDGVYGSFNCVLTEKTIPVFEPYNERAGIRFQSTLFGPTCDSLDQIPGVFMLPELVLGERLYIQNFGAYTSCLASDFNGFAKTPSFYIIKLPGERDEEEAFPPPPPKRIVAAPVAPVIKASL